MKQKEALKILDDIRNNRWGWLKIKRFDHDAGVLLAEKYIALDSHHAAETTRMVEVITELCELISFLGKEHKAMADRLKEIEEVSTNEDGKLYWNSSGNFVAETR